MIAAIFFSASICSASATNVYVAQHSSGAANGADCADAYAVTFFNTSSNWGSGSTQIGPGTTVHLCGTITSELAFHASGTSGSVIELLFETGASIQITPGMDANGIINLGGYSYILIDGGAGQPCGWNTATNLSEGTCNGTIENMLYGSSDGVCPGGTCTTQTLTGNLIQGTGSNIEIRNLNAGPSYVHTYTGNGGNDTSGTGGIFLENGSNWNIHDNKLHDGAWYVTLVPVDGGSHGNWTLTNNEMYNNSHMLAVAGNNATTLNGLTMSGNYMHGMANWWTSSTAWHSDGIHTYGGGASIFTNITVNNNIFGGPTSAPGGQTESGQIFSEVSFSSITNYKIFNNLFTDAGGDGVIVIEQCDSGCAVYNNTISGNGGTGIALGATAGNVGSINVENNVVTDAWSFVQTQFAGVTFGTLNYNTYGVTISAYNGWSLYGYGGITTLASWRSDSGGDANSTFTPTGISLNTNYTPQATWPAVNGGANLTSLCSGVLTALCYDLAGNARPSNASVKWDVGAYQYNSGTTSNSPIAPTGLTASVQ